MVAILFSQQVLRSETRLLEYFRVCLAGIAHLEWFRF